MNNIIKKFTFQSFFSFFALNIIGYSIPLSYIWGSAASFITLFQGTFPALIGLSPMNGLIVGLFVHFKNGKHFTILSFIKYIPSISTGIHLYITLKNKQNFFLIYIINITLFLIFSLLFIFSFSADMRSIPFFYILLWMPLLIPIFIISNNVLMIFITYFNSFLVGHMFGNFIYSYRFLPFSYVAYKALFFIVLLERVALSLIAIASYEIYTFNKNKLIDIMKSIEIVIKKYGRQ